MTVFKTIAVSFSMFSAIPMPRVDWNEDTMRYSLCTFPLIGVVIGLVQTFWLIFCSWFSFPGILPAAGLCLLPVLLTGGIHLDGYCDTCDARASHAEQARKLEILQDSHIGAFALIRCVCYLLASLALWSAFPFNLLDMPRTFLTFSGMLVLSRSLSGIAITAFPLAKDSGLAHTFATAADRNTVRTVLYGVAVAATALLFVGQGVRGLLVAVIALLCFGLYYRMAVREFGGLTGDLAGWFLQRCELWMLAALIFCTYWQ